MIWANELHPTFGLMGFIYEHFHDFLSYAFGLLAL